MESANHTKDSRPTPKLGGDGLRRLHKPWINRPFKPRSKKPKGSLTFPLNPGGFHRDPYNGLLLLWKLTAISPLKIGIQGPRRKKKSSSNHPFSGASCWFTGVSTWNQLKQCTIFQGNPWKITSNIRAIKFDPLKIWVPFTLLKTNSLPLKNDGWKTIILSFWVPECLFSGANCWISGWHLNPWKLTWNLKIPRSKNREKKDPNHQFVWVPS